MAESQVDPLQALRAAFLAAKHEHATGYFNAAMDSFAAAIPEKKEEPKNVDKP